MNERKNSMASVTVKDLFEAGVHFGHRTQKWNPRMKPYIFEARNGIYLIELEHTFRQLREAGDFLQSVAKRGEQILFVGCKKPAQEAVREVAGATGTSYVADRWLGGTLTNLQTIRKSVKRLEHIEATEKNGEMDKLPKQEAAKIRREKTKLLRNLSGIRTLEKAPGAMVVVDIVREQNALAEAKRLKIPIVAIVDTNADPTSVDYPVVGNDDAMRSIRILLETLADSYKKGTEDKGSRRAPNPTTEEPAQAAS
jgi:small subunit ribosomal protein S2